LKWASCCLFFSFPRWVDPSNAYTVHTSLMQFCCC
jgi:hypothetical protein